MLKQIVTVCIGFLILLVIYASPVQAESGKTYVVATENLEVMSEPAQAAEIIGLLKSGDKVTIFQEKYGWGKTFYGGKEAWVAMQFLSLIEEDDSQPKAKSKEKNKEGKKTIDSKTTNHAKKSEEWKKVEHTNVMSASLKISNPKTQRSDLPLSGYHFVLDPGHGGKDAGAIGVDSANEKKLTLLTAKMVAAKLRNEGATVTLTRENDNYISLTERIHISENNSTNAFISLHYNAFEDASVGGINTFYYSGEENRQLAHSIQHSLINAVELNNRGAKQANYYVLRNNNNQAILIELGFITNPKELEIIQTTTYQKKISEAIANGLKDYFTSK